MLMSLIELLAKEERFSLSLFRINFYSRIAIIFRTTSTPLSQQSLTAKKEGKPHDAVEQRAVLVVNKRTVTRKFKLILNHGKSEFRSRCDRKRKKIESCYIVAKYYPLQECFVTVLLLTSPPLLQSNKFFLSDYIPLLPSRLLSGQKEFLGVTSGTASALKLQPGQQLVEDCICWLKEKRNEKVLKHALQT